MKHIFLALSPKGYGETILGMRLANKLVENGDSCSFLIHESSAPLFTDPKFEYIKINERTLPLIGLLIQSQVKKSRADSIILSDYFTTALTFERAGINPQIVQQFDCPVGAIDTWDIKQTGTIMDFVGNQNRQFKDWTYLIDYLLTPVPIAKADSNANYYSCLPEPIVIPKKVNRHIRRDLGISEHDKIVLFCSAEWQHAPFKTEESNQLRDRFPNLLSSYFQQLGSQVILVHVGPAPLDLAIKHHYRWIPPLSPQQFDLLLASTDLLLTANVSSTTISKALVSGIPVVNLVNSFKAAEFVDTTSAHAKNLSPEFTNWVKEPIALHPFFMWPIGYHSFLNPLLENNPYTNAVQMLEITSVETVIKTIQCLLMENDYKQKVLEKQFSYVKEVESLPCAAELLYDHVNTFIK
jgi:hypothetical protein